MATVSERRIPLDGETDFLDIRLFIERGRVVAFVLNYTAVIDGESREVVRYDTCHGRLHVHRAWLDGPASLVDLEAPGRRGADYKARLRTAEADLRRNWRKYRSQVELKER